MEILQIRKETFVSTNKMTDVREVILNGKSHLNNNIELDFGLQRSRIQIAFEKDEDGWNKAKELYNEILDETSIKAKMKYALIVNIGSDNMVESWQWLNAIQKEQLVMPVEKRYRVDIGYGFDVELEVTAANKEEAYKKAKNGINSGKYADEMNDAMQGSSENWYSVNELDIK